MLNIVALFHMFARMFHFQLFSWFPVQVSNPYDSVSACFFSYERNACIWKMKKKICIIKWSEINIKINLRIPLGRDVALIHYPSCTDSIKPSLQFLCYFVVINASEGSLSFQNFLIDLHILSFQLSWWLTYLLCICIYARITNNCCSSK
jgi:hypothetical protein